MDSHAQSDPKVEVPDNSGSVQLLWAQERLLRFRERRQVGHERRQRLHDLSVPMGAVYHLFV